MRNPHPFNCDICGQGKQPSNNWMLGLMYPVDLKALEAEDGLHSDVTITNRSVIVSSWDEKLAVFKGVAHLCGVECAAKWSTKKFDELKSK